MKTDLPDQEKALLLVLILAYVIVILMICWFSFDFILHFFTHLISQTEINRLQ